MKMKKKIISLGLPKNESMEDYDKAMEAITEETLRCWDEEDEQRTD